MEYKVISDSTYDSQPDVRETHLSKGAWLAETIEQMGKDGWEFVQRLKGECIIFKRENK